MPKMIPKRYRNRDVAAAVGLSESTLTAFASAHGRTTRQGWTLPDIVELLESPRRNRPQSPVDRAAVEEIRAGLVCYGFRIEPDEQCAFDINAGSGLE